MYVVEGEGRATRPNLGVRCTQRGLLLVIAAIHRHYRTIALSRTSFAGKIRAMNIFLAAISGAGVALSLAAAAIFLVRNLIVERLKNAVAHEYAVKLETHRADVAATNLRTVERCLLAITGG
jgi:hypothetical protein